MISRAEALFAALVSTLAALVVVAYSIDRLGLAFHPLPMLFGGGAILLASLTWLWRDAIADDSSVGVAAALMATTTVWVLWLARPWILPAGSGPDLTHHLILIRYIERHWRLVHESSAEAFLGEMAYYTPGSHVLVALLGAWLRADGLQAFHPLIAFTVGLKTTFVFLIARRLAAQGTPRVPLAAIAALALFAAPRFFAGAFVEYSFLAQIVAELFGVAMWWALVAWDQESGRWPMCLFGLAGAALFLTWPVLIGPPVLALGLLVLTGWRSFNRRLSDALIGGGPIVFYAALFMMGRAAWVQLAGTGGETAQPSVAAYGWPFIVLSSAGLLLCAWRPRGRATTWVAVAFLTQSAVLYWVAVSRGNQPYMSLKLAYGFLFVQAAAITMVLSELWQAMPGPTTAAAAAAGVRTRGALAAWLAAGVVAASVGWSVAGAPKSLGLDYHPAISRPIEQAGKWAAINLPPACIDYLVPDVETAYWLHLAVLGNPRMSPRTGDDDTYELKKALVRWLTPGGLPYAIVDLPAVPSDVRGELDVVHRFGNAAVARRRGLATCPQP